MVQVALLSKNARMTAALPLRLLEENGLYCRAPCYHSQEAMVLLFVLSSIMAQHHFFFSFSRVLSSWTVLSLPREAIFLIHFNRIGAFVGLLTKSLLFLALIIMLLTLSLGGSTSVGRGEMTQKKKRNRERTNICGNTN